MQQCAFHSAAGSVDYRFSHGTDDVMTPVVTAQELQFASVEGRVNYASDYRTPESAVSTTS